MTSEERDRIAAGLSRQVAPALHIPDWVRVGVIACSDEEALRLQAHLMSCEGCRAPLIELTLKRTAIPPSASPAVSCARARDLMCSYLEGGSKPDDATLAHITSCDLCDDLFLEPAQAVILQEYEPEHVGEVD